MTFRDGLKTLFVVIIPLQRIKRLMLGKELAFRDYGKSNGRLNQVSRQIASPDVCCGCRVRQTASDGDWFTEIRVCGGNIKGSCKFLFRKLTFSNWFQVGGKKNWSKTRVKLDEFYVKLMQILIWCELGRIQAFPTVFAPACYGTKIIAGAGRYIDIFLYSGRTGVIDNGQGWEVNNTEKNSVAFARIRTKSCACKHEIIYVVCLFLNVNEELKSYFYEFESAFHHCNDT